MTIDPSQAEHMRGVTIECEEKRGQWSPKQIVRPVGHDESCLILHGGASNVLKQYQLHINIHVLT